MPTECATPRVYIRDSSSNVSIGLCDSAVSMTNRSAARLKSENVGSSSLNSSHHQRNTGRSETSNGKAALGSSRTNLPCAIRTSSSQQSRFLPPVVSEKDEMYNCMSRSAASVSATMTSTRQG